MGKGRQRRVRRTAFPWGSDSISHGRANYRASGGYPYDKNDGSSYHPAYNDGPGAYTSPKGSFTPNAYGLYDMAGNVYDWCWDWHPDYVGLSRVVRGGGWYTYAGGCRVANRSTGTPAYADSYFRFRAVLPPGQ